MNSDVTTAPARPKRNRGQTTDTAIRDSVRNQRQGPAAASVDSVSIGEPGALRWD